MECKKKKKKNYQFVFNFKILIKVFNGRMEENMKDIGVLANKMGKVIKNIVIEFKLYIYIY